MIDLCQLPERIARYVEPEPFSGCWLWVGSCDSGGYPLTGTGSLIVHRAMYEMYIGGIAEGFDVHHKCRTRICVNPNHLEAISGITDRKLRLIEQTHCKHGHPLEAPNIWFRKNGRRICKACTRALPYYNRRTEEQKRKRRERRHELG